MCIAWWIVCVGKYVDRRNMHDVSNVKLSQMSIHSPFSGWFITSVFSTGCLLPIFHLDCTRWCRIMFVVLVKNQCCWRRNYISHVIITPTQSIHTRDSWRDSDGTFCWPPMQNKSDHGSCVPFHVKLKITAFHLCEIALNQKLWCNFKRWCKFSSYTRLKLRNNKSRKTRPACTMIAPFMLCLCW
jgi:hypothetical protein